MAPDFTGNINHKLTVMVTEARDISQPLCEQAEDSDDGFEDEEKMVSAYLSNGLIVESKTAKGPSQNRLTKFTVFDGVN